MMTDVSKNSPLKTIRKGTWTRSKAKRLAKIVEAYKDWKAPRRKGAHKDRPVFLSRNEFLTFYKNADIENYRAFRQVADTKALFSKMVTNAVSYKVCNSCKIRLCNQVYVCSSCYFTPEGKALNYKLQQPDKIRTSLRRYGTENPMSSAKVKARHKTVMLAKYGEVNAMYNREVRKKHLYSAKVSHNTEAYKEKARQLQTPKHKKKVQSTLRKTNLERYGVTNPMLSEEGRKPWTKATAYWRTPEGKKEHQIRTLKSIQEKYGVDNVFQLPEIQKKIKKTLIRLYGVDHPLKNKDIRKRAIRNALSSRFKVKHATYKGKIFNHMGFELPAIKSLVIKYGYKDVFSNEAVDVLDLGERLYFPDLYVKSVDMYVEVKSLWTFAKTRRTFTHCQEKAKAADNKANLRWCLCSDKEVLIWLPKDWYSRKPKSFLLDLICRLPEKEQKFLTNLINRWDKYES